MLLPRGVERVVEEADLPVRARRPELLLQPRELRLVHVVAVQREEARAALGRLERVVALAAHVEPGVEALIRVVVVAERRVELDSGVEQRAVGLLELPAVVAWIVAPVDVVSQHEHELEWEIRPPLRQQARDVVLARLAGAAVADHRESQRPLLQRQRERCRGGRGGGRRYGRRARRQQRAEQQESGDRLRRAHGGDAHPTISFRKSTTRLACESWRIRWPPTKRYSSGSGSFGSLARRSGGTVDSGAPSG